MDRVKALEDMRAYFNTGATRSYAYRKAQLDKLDKALRANESALNEALYADLGKSREESWVTEIGFVLSEISFARKRLKKWMRPTRVPTNILNFPSRSYIMPEPMGVVLIIAPWNYPLNLLFTPMVGAIAAGNCIMLKAAEHAAATAVVMEKIIKETFEPHYISYSAEEGHLVIPAMMDHFRFDHVCYTGSTSTGQKIYEMAAKKLVPVTLELGGKSPAVVEADANITVAARRIMMTKTSNTGQMCVAPDYVLVHQSKQQEFIEAAKKALQQFYGAGPLKNNEYGKIIDRKQFDRLIGYIRQGEVIQGGDNDENRLMIAPTMLKIEDTNHPVMQEEIFGPLLPVLTFNTREEARAIISQHANPLAFYVFTENSKVADEWLEQVPAGGSCVNNASFHLANPHLPFGGRGNSGTGQYHGRYTFETFSHKKAVMRTPTWFDPAMRYPPFTGRLKLFKWMT